MSTHYVLTNQKNWAPGDVSLARVTADELDAKVMELMNQRLLAGSDLSRPIYAFSVDSVPWLKYTGEVALTGDVFDGE